MSVFTTQYTTQSFAIIRTIGLKMSELLAISAFDGGILITVVSRYL